MNMIAYFISHLFADLKKRKNPKVGWLWWSANSLAETIIYVFVWFFWMLSWFNRKWTWTKSTVGELYKYDVDRPFSVDEMVKHIKATYPPETKVAIIRRPSFYTGYDVWTFKVDGGISNSKQHIFELRC